MSFYKLIGSKTPQDFEKGTPLYWAAKAVFHESQIDIADDNNRYARLERNGDKRAQMWSDISQYHNDMCTFCVSEHFRISGKTYQVVEQPKKPKGYNKQYPND
jgi:L-ribulose-5-phosphate 3-epimerase UlaE